MTTEQSIYSKKSNEQRLKFLDQYDEERKERKRLIKESLANPNVKKHVKFDSDDDDNVQSKEFEEKKLQLFDNDDGVNIDEHFNPTKTTKKKRKLKALQAKMTNTTDPRFQFSEQFLDDHIDEEDQQEISIEDEKNKSLAILDQITNAKSTKTKSKSKMIRFDPSKTEHRIYELDSEVPIDAKHSSSPKKSILKISKDKSTTPIVDSTRVYELDQTRLKSVFDKSMKTVETPAESTQFQFQFFQNDSTTPSASETSTTAVSLPKLISNGKAKKLTMNIHDSSSEDEEEKSSTSNGNKIEREEEPMENRTFFFFDIDNRLKDGLETFVRTEDLNELEKNWPTKRKEIAEALRTKHRKALARKDKQRISKHRHRQTTKST